MRDFLHTLADAIRVIVHGHTLNEIKQHHDRQYFANKHRLSLIRFEKVVKAIRNKEYDTNDLSPELQEWATYTRREFYIQLKQMYARFNYYYDVDRIGQEAEKGTATVTVTPDGSETVIDHKDGTLSADVVKHGHTVEF